jgi:outer membrane protein OmpA-like peptidoglycan-associated protein/DNA-binding transcriptional LysR family regulator
MNKNIIGALLIVVLVSLGAVGVKLLLPLLEESRQKVTSDSIKIKGKIRIALDNWVGYFFLDSPELESALHKAGYLIVCEDDNADYARRMERLRHDEIDFAVATVDAFILNGARHNFPGAIIMVIDESKGGDAILAVKEKAASLDALKGRSDLRIAFTPDSPSHHLAKAAAEHFNIPELLPTGTLRLETEGSQKARQKLLSGQADVAILWEPDVSKAMASQGIVKILGSEDTDRLIVDVLVAGRETLRKRPEVVQILLNHYFRVLKKYRDNPDLMQKHLKAHTGLSKDVVAAMVKGVHWTNFNENCEKWYGIAAPMDYADQGLVETIDATIRILRSAGDFESDPLPDGDPYRLTNSMFLEEMFTKGISGFTTPGNAAGTAGGTGSLEARFSPMDAAQWERLKEVGTLKVAPIIFQHGATELDLLAKTVVDQCVERLKHYPNFRILINGHSGTRGDKKENLRLSQDRADAVARYLIVVYNVDSNRIRIRGLGGTQPLPREPGESRRSWMYRLPRVEFKLMREDY